MALGRNVLYNKELFINQNGFNKHKHILGGDDDLFVNQIANSKNVATCLDKRAYTISKPNRNWGSWISQKHRHLSVGKFYRLKHKLTLGAFHLSNMIFYVSFFTHFLMDRLDLVITTGFFLRTVSQIVIFDKSAKTYGMKINSFLSPIWDLGYTLYSCFLGTYSSLIGRKKWK